MSKITNDCLTRTGTGSCFIAVPIYMETAGFKRLRGQRLKPLCVLMCAKQRLWRLTQATEDWQPADDDAKLIVAQQQQQRRGLSMMTSNNRVVATSSNRPVELVGYTPRQDDDVTGHVTDVRQDAEHTNAAFDYSEKDVVNYADRGAF